MPIYGISRKALRAGRYKAKSCTFYTKKQTDKRCPLAPGHAPNRPTEPETGQKNKVRPC